MPSTSALPSLTIGFRRAEKAAFWVLTTGLVSVILGLAALAVGAASPWKWAGLGLCAPLPGLLWPVWFELGIRAWNKGARLVSAALRSYVLHISYYLLFGAVSRAGSSLDLGLRAGERSKWVPRLAGAAATDLPRATDPRAGAGARAWTICVTPVMQLLLLLRDEEQESAPPPSTYTLY